MSWSVDDLATITDMLITGVSDAVKATPRFLGTPFVFEVSGLMPAVDREKDNILSLYLLQVGRDPFWRNTPTQGSRGLLNTSQPLSLNLSYLLTSFASRWQTEQFLMSVALAWFHANPIFQSPALEFTITVEADSIEEMSRLWQAIAVPIRLSALFRVAVVFLAPTLPTPVDARKPIEVGLSIGADLNAPPPAVAVPPRLFAVAPQTSYSVSPAAVAAADVIQLVGQAAAIGGQSVEVRGSGLNSAQAAQAFLSLPSTGDEWPIPASWIAAPIPASGTASVADELLLHLPVAYGPAPASGTALAATPLPAAYQLAVGQGAFRSNRVPLTIGPRMNGIGTGQPVLAPSALGVYLFAASGLVGGETVLLLNTHVLTLGAAPAPGVYAVDLATGVISFELPAGLVSQSFLRVRLIVNSIEAPPGWWVKVP